MDNKTKQEILNIVKKNYQEIAKDFNETRKKYLWPELIKLTTKINDNNKILDAGCGNGRLLRALWHKKISYLGIDSSQDLINLAKKNNTKVCLDKQSEKNNNNLNFEFKQGDLLNLGQIPEINFDYIFCVAALHHIPSKELRIQVLKNLKNKLKPNGEIIITVWNLWTQAKFRKLFLKFALLKIIKKKKYDFGDIFFDWKNPKGQLISQRYYHAFTKRELKKISKKAELKIKQLYNDKFNYYLILSKPLTK